MSTRAHFLAFDTETTGLVPESHQIISVAMVLLDIELTILDTLEIHAFPDADALIDEKAVEVNGYTREKWEEKGAVTQKEMFSQIQKFLKGQWRLKPIAHNLPFDVPFLRALFMKFFHPARDKAYNDFFSYFGIDTLGIAVFADLVLHNQTRSTYKLSSLSEHYKIKHEEAHTALSDVLAMVAVLRAMRDNLRTRAGVGEFARAIPDNHMLLCTDKDTPVWTFTGGKYKDTHAHDVILKDRKYIQFVLGFPDLSDAQRNYLNALCQKSVP